MRVGRIDEFGHRRRDGDRIAGGDVGERRDALAVRQIGFDERKRIAQGFLLGSGSHGDLNGRDQPPYARCRVLHASVETEAPATHDKEAVKFSY